MTRPFLRLPPFPGSRPHPLSHPGTSRFALDEVRAALVAHQVGGAFWLEPAELEPGHGLVLVPDNAAQLSAMLAAAAGAAVTLACPDRLAPPRGAAVLRKYCDPWSVAQQAREIWAGSHTDVATIAALLGKPVRLFDGAGALDPQPDLVLDLMQRLSAHSFTSPFDGTPWSVLQVIEQLGQWRQLIASNRELDGIFGIARWKRVTVDPLLWNGSGPVRHLRRVPPGLGPGSRVAAWKSRTAPGLLTRLQAAGVAVAEIEDGLIRSVGLGANCVPPLSVIVDRTGIYFDPNGSSELERMLESDDLPLNWVKRAASLRASLVNAGISKYEQGHSEPEGWPKQRRTVLVPGQVEDDRSVLSAGGNCTNLELLIRTRRLEPDAWIIYKPHPDVEAGHRQGHVPEAQALRHADAIARRTPIAALIDQVDAVHVITSLAGFEALLRGKSVTTHGQPFYAGWGLTADLGPDNPRRTRRRSRDELIAAALIGYPRYVDPVTRLPCPPEVLVRRIVAAQAKVTSPLTVLRAWQGKLRLAWRRLTGGRR